MMTNWRPHRFPPLAQLLGTEAWQASLPADASARMHASLAEGFQQGMERGYREGYDSGLRSGLEAGLAQGRDEGREAGRREALARFESIAVPVEAMLRSLESLQADYQQALRKEVVDLVAKVARQVIRCELALQPAQLLALVDEALLTLPRTPKEQIEVYLNAEDLERIRELDPERAARWNIVADARLEHGECRIRAGNHEADAGCRQRLAACMEQVAAQLLPHADGEGAQT